MLARIPANMPCMDDCNVHKYLVPCCSHGGWLLAGLLLLVREWDERLQPQMPLYLLHGLLLLYPPRIPASLHDMHVLPASPAHNPHSLQCLFDKFWSIVTVQAFLPTSQRLKHLPGICKHGLTWVHKQCWNVAALVHTALAGCVARPTQYGLIGVPISPEAHSRCCVSSQVRLALHMTPPDKALATFLCHAPFPSL